MGTRLDIAMTQRGLARTRSQARDLVKRGTVTVDGEPERRPGRQVTSDHAIAVSDGAAEWVSRAALKLVAAFDGFGLNCAGKRCLDLGASTGGFTQVLLANGAAHVYAVDVGSGQLVSALASDPRVTSLENTDARRLTPELVHYGQAGPIDVVTADVSFISVTKVIGPALALTAVGAWCVVLVKPQFELEPGAMNGQGVVTNPADRQRAIDCVQEGVRVEASAMEQEWEFYPPQPSPVAGKVGNLEWLLHAVRQQ
ncbi:MAG: TlyA family RNA methyltransferase [Pseudomonadota bacterium]